MLWRYDSRACNPDCLDLLERSQKHPLFSRYFKSAGDLLSISKSVSLAFADGLFDTLKVSSPPAIQFFKDLPSTPIMVWGVYVIVFEQPGYRPRLYIGSATSIGTPTSTGIRLRFKQYEDGFLLPQHVSASLEAGFTITSKSLICWSERPNPALQPVCRLLFLVLEATFTFVFWALKAKKGSYGMGAHQFLGPTHARV